MSKGISFSNPHGMLYPQSFPCQAPSPAGRTPHCLTPQGPLQINLAVCSAFRVSYFPSVNNYRTVVIKHFTFQSFLNGRAVTSILKVEPGAYSPWVARQEKEHPGFNHTLPVFLKFFAWGSKFGLLAKARTSPVLGSMATTAPFRPLSSSPQEPAAYGQWSDKDCFPSVWDSWNR